MLLAALVTFEAIFVVTTALARAMLRNCPTCTTLPGGALILPGGGLMLA